MKIEIDGNDGTGKSTLIAKLKELNLPGIEFSDRGRITKATDDESIEPEEDVKYILLHAPVEVCRERLAKAGKDLNEKYHTIEDLTYYNEKFLDRALKFEAVIVDATKSTEEVYNYVLSTVNSFKERIVFVDLHHVCSQVKSKLHLERISELSQLITDSAIVAVCGIPICKDEFNNKLTWAGYYKEDISRKIREGLGFSGILTYMNKHNKSLDELGYNCVGNKHYWAYHWMSVSIVFSQHPLIVEMSFARDTRFFLSWPLEANPTGQVFVATASIKDWLDYVAHKEDGSFDSHTRQAMKSANYLLNKILPQ